MADDIVTRLRGEYINDVTVLLEEIKRLRERLAAHETCVPWADHVAELERRDWANSEAASRG
jgi:hypothetical protein